MASINSVRTFDHVAFKEWNTQDGLLILNDEGFIYQASGEEDDEGLKMSKSWSQVDSSPMLNRGSVSSGKHLLKITIQGDAFVFQMPSRESSERVKEEINARRRAFKYGGASETMETDDDSEGTTRYAPVSFRGHDGGCLKLTDEASQEKALLRIVDSRRYTYIFQMTDRKVLQRIRKDIIDRRQAARQTPKDENDKWPVDSRRQYTQLRATSPGANKRHGPNRIKYDAVKPGFGSFPRTVGPAADLRELEYISCLHQNAELLLRSDGTISSEDIAPYLSSRYGVIITDEQAIDIACNLCGAKTRNEFSAEMDAHNDALRHPEQKQEEEKETQDDDSAEYEEEKYYFDIVQLASLLVIPELVQIAEQHKRQAGSNVFDTSEPVSFRFDDVDELAPTAPAVIQLARDSLLEIFDEDLKNDLCRGRPLDAELLSVMLESFGDVDSAENPSLIEEMLECLDPESRSLSAENLMVALTNDVRSHSKQAQGGETKPKMTSVFFDCFGWNWDDRQQKKAAQKDGTLNLDETATFIDYAADTYRSLVHNTAVWCLFILTTLIYLNFFRTLVQSNWKDPVCGPDKNYGCTVGNKIVEWIINAIFCGCYGVFFILPTSIGNVTGQKALLFLTLLVTASFTFAPFATLIWYEKGIPYNVTYDYDYRVICPFDFNQTEAKLWMNDPTTDPTQNYLVLDSACHSAVEWCEEHPEVQGKYLDEYPSTLSYDEFEKCYTFFTEKAYPEYGLWVTTGNECDPDDFFNSTCPDFGACARRDMAADSPYICCHSGTSAFYDKPDFTFDSVCDMQPPGSACQDGLMCESYVCSDTDKVCVSAPQDPNNNTKQLGEACNRSNLVCQSGFCWNGTCQPQPTICPLDGVEVLGGLRIDPFCRTLDDWCNINNVETLQLGLGQWGLVDFTKDICRGVLDVFIGFELVRELNESEAELGYTYETLHLNPAEEVLLDDWTYFILISIPIVGFFALMAILRGLLLKDTNARPRDYKIKCAASSKIGNLIENALNMRSVSAGRGQVMRNYFLHGEEVVEVGGLFYTLGLLRSGKLVSSEGIRFSGRIFVGQVVQIIVTVIGIAYAVGWVKYGAQVVDDIRQDLDQNYTPEEVKNISNYEWVTYTQDDLRTSEQEETLLDLWPESWMVEVAGYPAVALGTLVALFCIIIYIPSYTSTVIKLRSGMIPSLHDPNFMAYRIAGDNVVQNIGNMVFSLMGASVFLALLVFGLIFVFAWPQTRGRALGFLAIAIGIICTIIIKVVGQKLLRARNFSTFYRKRPLAANAANLFFECWYIGTGLLVVVSRLVIFLVTAALYLGRIDTAFFHPDVKVVGKNLDKIPEGFRRDLLVHEAHLHPYIERLGSMYLHRIRDGDKFGSKAGTAWRCLFISALIPWIVRHRVNTNDVMSGLSEKL
ncbi:expressed unknown protein [Seminavis robusta]|uniref:Uncharacterized protein n=1 Tax=Seminavis robusta TaxID=568900 RepID=A0A9N8DJD6_9STRA|nr:expressed unknown protein [Seminavis robusta]|eukprot:Sro174_g076630.1 n/a (1405) ;mRNA; r:34942-40409